MFALLLAIERSDESNDVARPLLLLLDVCTLRPFVPLLTLLLLPMPTLREGSESKLEDTKGDDDFFIESAKSPTDLLIFTIKAAIDRLCLR
jgi:hypothetical protein